MWALRCGLLGVGSQVWALRTAGLSGCSPKGWSPEGFVCGGGPSPHRVWGSVR